jgi:pimeloyl-ACP methyl ester carboxylesterase
MDALTPFHIDVPEAKLQRIRDGLRAADFSYAPEGSGWEYGVDVAYLRDLVDYWIEHYDWRRWEAQLNRFPQFSTHIDGVDVRFQHIKGSGKRGPILMTHGWPGSIFEFDQAAERLAFPERFGGKAEDGFDLIIPSLPGFGFSSRPARPIGPRAVSRMWRTLMVERLGYDRFVVQGGDFGSAVSNWLAHDAPEHVAGVHLNLCIPMPVPAAEAAPGEVEWRAAYEAVQRRESAYMMEHMTKPQTIGAALSASPVAFAAWVIEKFHGWADTKGDIESRFSKDQLITNLMTYLVNDAVTSAIWMYAGTAAEAGRGLLTGLKVTAPTAVALFPAEFIPPAPREAMARNWNLTRLTQMPEGGHFAAFEEPQRFADDVREFFLGLDLQDS